MVQEATFDGANLKAADFDGAKGSAWFKDVNLKAALHLDFIEVLTR
jgi:uncharacterized protein YjbI with pentapeptide repeats